VIRFMNSVYAPGTGFCRIHGISTTSFGYGGNPRCDGDCLRKYQPGEITAAIVEVTFPYNRLFPKMNIMRSGPASFPSASSALPAARASCPTP